MPSAGSSSVRGKMSSRSKPAEKKVRCECTVSGCKTATRPYSMIAPRTRRYHQTAQAAHDGLARSRAAQGVLASTQLTAAAASSSSSGIPLRRPEAAIPRQEASPPPAKRPALARLSSPEPGMDVLPRSMQEESGSDFGNDFMQQDPDDEDMGRRSLPPSPPLRRHPSEPQDPDEDEPSESDNDEVDSDFGADVEQRPRLDPTRPTLASFEVEDEDDDPNGEDEQRQQPSAPAPAHTLPSAAQSGERLQAYSAVVRAFILLVVFFTTYYGLGRQPASLLLSFFAKKVHPLLVDDRAPPPLQLATVRAQLGITPALVRYAVCPGCEHLTPVAAPSTTCSKCSSELYERPGKPKITFAYHPIKHWLAWLLQHPGMELALQEWRDREPTAFLQDVYDGTAWQDERDNFGRRFTDHSLSLLGALGVDWFSPFRSQYTSWHSTGGIMLSLLNLPPRLRYKKATTYLAGCTPGPKEPTATKLGCYLEPLLDELEELADGVTLPTHTAPQGRLVRLRLACYVGDSVGRNKVCGFPAHTVRKGEFCGYCRVTIATRFASLQDGMQLRDADQHRLDSIRASSPFRTKRLEDIHKRTTGARSSPLTRLKYWRSVLRAPVDHMHCVELGLLKRFFHRVLIVGKVISDSQLRTLQAALGATVVPPTEQAPDKRLGDPGGGSATAAHWSTLGRRLLVLLLFVAWKDLVEQDGNVHYIPTAPAAPTAAEALDRNAEDVLAEEAQRARGDGGQDSDHDDSRPASPASGQSQERHRLPQGAVTLSTRQVLQNAAQLAAVATLVARRLIKHSEVDELEKLLRNFSITHRELFGDKALVYNVHMAMHIPDHIRTFGPAWHFSAYHFESMNGQLGRTPTNRHRNGEIETTYTTAFTTNARFELMLSSNDAGLDVASARAPQVAVPPTLRLDFASFVRDQGAGIDIELGPSKPFTLPAPLYHSLLAHLRKYRPAGAQPFLPSWSDAAGGARVNGRMKEHDSIKLGHTMFRSKSARTNASKAFTHAVVRARNGAEDRLDLFAIERILSHEIMRAGTCLQSVFVQGRRAERASLPGFDQVIDEAGVGSILRLFWTRKEVWSEVELLPAAQVFSDAVTVPNGDLVGVSAGEALRCATL